MTKEIAKAFSNVYEQMNDIGKRIDNLYSQLHCNNAENIEANAGGIDELAESIEMQNEALNDLAMAITELEG